MAKADIFNLPVHPSANVFPMLPDDELDELAADIKANGLVHPLIVKDGVLIDGRNRREACRRAGVEPRTQELNGQDPNAYIISSNVNRRHMTKGQRAMAVAMIYPEASAHRGKRSEAAKVLETKSFSLARLSQARTVLRVLPEAAKAVLSGATTLDRALEDAQREVTRAESLESRLARLAAKHDALATKVREGELSIDAAEVEAQHRDQREEQRRATFVLNYQELIGALEFFRSSDMSLHFSALVCDATMRANLLRRNATLEGDIAILKDSGEILDAIIADLEAYQ